MWAREPTRRISAAFVPTAFVAVSLLATSSSARMTRATPSDLTSGGTIAYVRDRVTKRPYYGSELWVMRADGSGKRLVPTNPYYDDTSPSWSPDGRHMVFAHRPHGSSPNIWVIGSRGAQPRPLTRGARGPGDQSPAWSPDGRKILFTSPRDHGLASEIYVMDADGSGQKRLTKHIPGSILPSFSSPAWSPDGRSIAYLQRGHHTGFDPGNWVWNATFSKDWSEVWIMRADGSHHHRLVRGSPSLAPPAWSPDGQRIAFERVVDGQRDIFVIGVDGSGLRNLTNSTADDGMPAWSPDGKSIAFARGAQQSDIYVMQLRTGDVQRLTSSHVSETSPDWGP